MSRQSDEINIILNLDEVASIITQMQNKQDDSSKWIRKYSEGSEGYEYYKNQINDVDTLLEKLSLASGIQRI